MRKWKMSMQEVAGKKGAPTFLRVFLWLTMLPFQQRSSRGSKEALWDGKNIGSKNKAGSSGLWWNDLFLSAKNSSRVGSLWKPSSTSTSKLDFWKQIKVFCHYTLGSSWALRAWTFYTFAPSLSTRSRRAEQPPRENEDSKSAGIRLVFMSDDLRPCIKKDQGKGGFFFVR